jgi:hypothetical protein
MSKQSHVSSDFQLFLIPTNAPIRIQMMLELLVDNYMDKALPMVRWVVMFKKFYYIIY